MTDALTCPQCHSELPSNAPAGMCPRCLMEAALARSSDENQVCADSPYAETTPQPRSFLPPESGVLANQFPHLEILELLGQGGMGAVYKARQPKLDRLVALKIIRPESADDPAFAERFNREARTLARLSHPNIVAVHDFGEVTLSQTDSDGSPRTLYYFLMEYVDGANLRQLMDRGELSPERVPAIVSQICEALQFAHDEGVVHRDIKPENILVDSRGRVKIADFGLAKLASPSQHDFTLTGTHQVMGTPRYMAPEQMAGSRAVDHRADLYALGVVFYEMLTGEIPAGHFSSPSAHAPIDVRLDDVVMKALAPKPEDRFQSANEIRASLQAISQEPGVSVISQVSTPSLPPARGLSTVFERQVAAAWHWMAERTPPGDQTSANKTAAQFPGLLMGLLCVIGLLMPLAPWMIIAVTDPDVVHGSPPEEVTTFHGSDAKLIEKSGFEHPAGVASAMLLMMMAVLCLSVPTWRRPNRLIAFLMVGLSGCAFLELLVFPNQAPHIYLDFNPPAAEPEPGVTVVTSQSTQPISNLDHKIYLQPAFYGSMTVSGILLLLSAVGLRHAEPLRKTDRAWRDVWTGELAANLLLASTIVLSLAGGLTMLLPWAEIQIPMGADVTQVDDTARLIAPVAQSFIGIDVWSSTAAPALCLLVGFILLLSPQRRSPGWIVTGLMTVCSVAAVIHLATYPAALQSHRSITLPLEVS
ncbi:MAG: serine/threonine protein kinase, partial [Planctomycetes bacterium]|nr:serine/threonine protein kinase [Planctomycetota bacterium]